MTSTANGSEIEQSLETEIAGNIRALSTNSEAFHRPENGNGVISRDNLGALLRRVSEALRISLMSFTSFAKS